MHIKIGECKGCLFNQSYGVHITLHHATQGWTHKHTYACIPISQTKAILRNQVHPWFNKDNYSSLEII